MQGISDSFSIVHPIVYSSFKSDSSLRSPKCPYASAVRRYKLYAANKNNDNAMAMMQTE